MITMMAFDPGVVTGIAVTEVNGSAALTFNTNQTEPRIFPHPHESLYDIIGAINPDILIYEAFHFRQGQLGAVTTGIEYIGVIELWSQQNYKEISKITPSDGKAFWNDKKIKALGLWQPNQRHGMDALRILLTYLMRTNQEFKTDMLYKLKEVLPA